MLRDNPSFIYLIQGDRWYKIGLTRNVSRRLKELGTRLPFKTHLLHVIEVCGGDLEAEQELHNRYAEYRANGEWFELPYLAVLEIMGMEVWDRTLCGGFGRTMNMPFHLPAYWLGTRAAASHKTTNPFMEGTPCYLNWLSGFREWWRDNKDNGTDWREMIRAHKRKPLVRTLRKSGVALVPLEQDCAQQTLLWPALSSDWSIL
jgi:hypothetical protein